MPRSPHPALLPPGFADLLPPHAGLEGEMTHNLLRLYASWGYERVTPPLIEFEESLLAGAGYGMSRHIFRLMDPLSGRMLGLSADITVQVARIATTRIPAQPRPLRLAYAGQTVRQLNSEHRPERQFGQVGFELIGSAAPGADAEAIHLACASLAAIGIENGTLDISLPTLIVAICGAAGLSAQESGALRHALDRKDRAAVTAIGGMAGALAAELLRLSGAIEPALEGLARLDLPPQARAERDHLFAVWDIVAKLGLTQTVTLDLVEHRGFEYQTGLSFTLFAGERGTELGRGGRYFSKAHDDDGAGEPATGFTFYSNNLLSVSNFPARAPQLYVPRETNIAITKQFREKGYITIMALEPDSDPVAAARALSCTHILRDGQPEKLEKP